MQVPYYTGKSHTIAYPSCCQSHQSGLSLSITSNVESSLASYVGCTIFPGLCHKQVNICVEHALSSFFKPSPNEEMIFFSTTTGNDGICTTILNLSLNKIYCIFCSSY